MYKEYFGFTKEPFNITPDPDFFYCSEIHEEILSVIEYQLNKRKGFLVLTGDVGTGKTLLCRTLINKLINFKTSLILNPFLNEVEILRYICIDFGIINKDDNVHTGKLFHYLTEFLVNLYKNNKNALIIVDEAQNLSFQAFEMIRHISNIELEDTKLVQILFVGQTELIDKINLPELRQLKQRISTILELKPLNKDECIHYINFRIQESLKYKKFIFKNNAFKNIYKYTKGYPREINRLCETALITAFGNNHKYVTKNDVDLAAKEFYKNKKIKHKEKTIYIFLLILILSISSVYAIFYVKFNQKTIPLKPVRVPTIIKKHKNNNITSKKPLKKVDKNIIKPANIKNRNIVLKTPDNNTNIIKNKSTNGNIYDNNYQRDINFEKQQLKSNHNPLEIKDNLSIFDKLKNNLKDEQSYLPTTKTTKKLFYNCFMGPIKNKQKVEQIVKKLRNNKIDYFTNQVNDKFFIFIGYFIKKKNVNILKHKLYKIGIDNISVEIVNR